MGLGEEVIGDVETTVDEIMKLACVFRQSSNPNMKVLSIISKVRGNVRGFGIRWFELPDMKLRRLTEALGTSGEFARKLQEKSEEDRERILEEARGSSCNKCGVLCAYPAELVRHKLVKHGVGTELPPVKTEVQDQDQEVVEIDFVKKEFITGEDKRTKTPSASKTGADAGKTKTSQLENKVKPAEATPLENKVKPAATNQLKNKVKLVEASKSRKASSLSPILAKIRAKREAQRDKQNKQTKTQWTRAGRRILNGKQTGTQASAEVIAEKVKRKVCGVGSETEEVSKRPREERGSKEADDENIKEDSVKGKEDQRSPRENISLVQATSGNDSSVKSNCPLPLCDFQSKSQKKSMKRTMSRHMIREHPNQVQGGEDELKEKDDMGGKAKPGVQRVLFPPRTAIPIYSTGPFSGATFPFAVIRTPPPKPNPAASLQHDMMTDSPIIKNTFEISKGAGEQPQNVRKEGEALESSVKKMKGETQQGDTEDVVERSLLMKKTKKETRACERCDTKIRDSSHWAKHQRSTKCWGVKDVLKNADNRCPDCDKTMRNNWNLHRHHRRMHK